MISRKRTLSTFLASVLGLALLLVAGPALAEQKVAVVDVHRAVAQTEDGLRAQATLKKLFDSRQQELNRKQTDLQRQREDIDKQSKVMSKEALAKRVEDWQKQMMELQAVFVEYNKELEKKQKELTEPVFEKMMGIIRNVDPLPIPVVANSTIKISRNGMKYCSGFELSPARETT